MRELPDNPSESFKRRNPHLYPGMATVEARRPERSEIRALDGDDASAEGGATSVEVRVVIITLRRRLLDSDSVSYACKSIRDQIADDLGIDDADPRITWQCEQFRTDGEEGVIVKIDYERA